MVKIDLQRIRKDHGLTQLQLAGMVHMKQSYISQMENGHVPISKDFLERLEAALGITDFSRYVIDTVRSASTQGKKTVRASVVRTSDYTGADREQLLVYLDERDNELQERNNEIKQLKDELLESQRMVIHLQGQRLS